MARFFGVSKVVCAFSLALAVTAASAQQVQLRNRVAYPLCGANYSAFQKIADTTEGRYYQAKRQRQPSCGLTPSQALQYKIYQHYLLNQYRYLPRWQSDLLNLEAKSY